MNFSFYAWRTDTTTLSHPQQLQIEASSKAEAVNRLCVEYSMKVAELAGDHVWLELPDGAFVQYGIRLDT